MSPSFSHYRSHVCFIPKIGSTRVSNTLDPFPDLLPFEDVAPDGEPLPDPTASRPPSTASILSPGPSWTPTSAFVPLSMAPLPSFYNRTPATSLPPDSSRRQPSLRSPAGSATSRLWRLPSCHQSHRRFPSPCQLRHLHSSCPLFVVGHRAPRLPSPHPGRSPPQPSACAPPAVGSAGALIRPSRRPAAP